MADETKSIRQNIINQFKKFKKIIAVDDSRDYEKTLSKISQSAAKFANPETRNIFQDLVKAIYTKNIGSKDNVNTTQLIKDLMTDFGIGPGPEPDRLTRYLEYEEIVSKISYAKRALMVIKDNIMSPDDYMYSAFKFVNEDPEDLETQELLKIYKIINSTLNIENYADEIIESTLWFGDYFVEIVVVNDELKKHGLLESTNFKNTVEKIPFELEYDVDDKKERKKIELKIENVVSFKDLIQKLEEKIIEKEQLLEDDSENTDVQDIKLKKNNEFITNMLSNIYLVFYKPSRVVRIGNNPCFGYLVFPDLKNLSPGIKHPGTITADSARKILARLLNKIHNKDEHVNELLKQPEVKKLISQLLIYQEQGAFGDSRVRYVPPDNMIHFKLDSLKNSPYGQSIFFGQEFLAKLLILIQTTIAIYRITNSGEKRIIAVEVGLPRDARQIVEDLKLKFKRRKYSVDNIGTIKDIPSALTTFEDIYLPMKDGKRFVEFDTASLSRNISDRVEDLQAIRDHFIAGLLVPPAFLSVEENLESKATLSQQNILFTRNIMNYQRIFTRYFTELFRKIYMLLYRKQTISTDLEKVVVTFSKPRSLKIELDSEYYNNLNDLIETLSKFGISKDYIVKRYLKDDIDQELIEQLQIQDKLDKTIENEEEESGGF